MDIINDKIKEMYDSKAHFSEQLGVNPKDLASKIKTVKNRINLTNKFLKHLNLKVKIEEI